MESVLGSLDINVFEVYEMTPKELLLKSKQLQAMGREQLKQDISVAYFAERFARSKKLPKLDKILKGVDKPTAKTNSVGDMVLKAMAKEKGVEI